MGKIRVELIQVDTDDLTIKDRWIQSFVDEEGVKEFCKESGTNKYEYHYVRLHPVKGK